MVETLGRSIRDLYQEGLWAGVNVSNGVEHSTHLQFADDTILFGASSRGETRVIKSCLDEYCKASRQSINWNKSEVFFVNTHPRLQRSLSRILNLRVANFLGRFFENPSFHKTKQD